jgi:hypothetical protein
MRLNRFVINGWPPVASHLGFLLLGCGMSAVSPSPPGPAAPLPGSIIVRLKPSAQAARWQDGMRLDAWKSGRDQCRLNHAPLVVASLVPSPLVALDRRDAALALTLTRRGLGGVVLRPAATTRAPLCPRQGKVRYGAS